MFFIPPIRPTNATWPRNDPCKTEIFEEYLFTIFQQTHDEDITRNLNSQLQLSPPLKSCTIKEITGQ